MTERVLESGLQIAKPIYDLVNQSIIPGTSLSPKEFWPKFAAIVERFSPLNRDLLAIRVDLQSQIDAWHSSHQDGFELVLHERACRLRQCNVQNRVVKHGDAGLKT